jgi:hypothetical protein
MEDETSENLDVLMTREQAAEALTKIGFLQAENIGGMGISRRRSAVPALSGPRALQMERNGSLGAFPACCPGPSGDGIAMTVLTQGARRSSPLNTVEVEPILIAEWPLNNRGENYKGTWLISLRKCATTIAPMSSSRPLPGRSLSAAPPSKPPNPQKKSPAEHANAAGLIDC